MIFPRLAAAFLILLLLNTAYVAAFAEASLFYMANVLLHLLLGVGATVVFLGSVREMPWWARGLLSMSALVGGWLAWAGNTLPHRNVLWAHIVLGAAFVVVAVPWMWKRLAGAPRHALGASAALLVLVPALVTLWTTVRPDPRLRIRNPQLVPVSMEEEGGGPKSPFWPSSSQTNVGGTIPSDFFMDSKLCGECHKDIYDQWNSSVHHFASFNNQFYRKSIEYMQSIGGTKGTKWCAGCHDHALFFNGRFEKPVIEQIDTPEAQNGLGCVSCHSISHVDGTTGNGGFTIEYPPLHDLASSRNRYIRMADTFLTYLDPEPHRKTFLKPFMREDNSEFCSTCHKVHLDVPVNNYRWIRGFNDYDNWQASGVSGQGARSFYYPPKTSTCGECHMPMVKSQDPGNRNGMVHNHRFAAANTAVAHVNGDKAQLDATVANLKSGFITVDIFAASPVQAMPGQPEMQRRKGAEGGPQLASTFAVGEEAEQSGAVFLREVGQLAAPMDRSGTKVEPGSTVKVDVVVRTRKIGHFFPGGTVDSFDIWLELTGTDANGKNVFWSGRVDDDGKGPVETGAHFYRSYQLDAEGNPINKRNAFQSRSLLYVRLIPPGAADVAHYRVKLPKDVKGPVTLHAKLNYRKFSHFYTQFSYAGQPEPGQDPSLVSVAHDSRKYSFSPANIPANVSGNIKGNIPDLPIITLAEAKSRIEIGSGGAPEWKPVVKREDRERWNDWGIGLLLQGDLKGAEYAFTRVTEAEPGYADGWLNVARALIQEGEVERAKPFIEKALQLDSSLGRIHFFKAAIQKAEGDYDGALKSLRTTEAKYPRDRVVLNQIGRILFLKRDFAGSVESLKRVLAVDPEDVQAHYTLMLSYRGLGKVDEAAREEKLFKRFKADESAQAITGKPRLLNAEDNNERQMIHDHESVALTSGGAEMISMRVLLAGLLGVSAVLAGEVKFTDVSGAAGIRFTHNSGRAGKKFLPETMGSGCAFFDADGDGWVDVVLLNSKDWTPRGRKSISALYLNNKNGTFRNAAAGSGLDVEMFAMGVAAADYDNDGREDLYVTALEGDRLFHNEGGGKFRDVTKASGIANASFGTSVAWLDFDKDGRADLFVANYVQWTAKGDLWCSLDGATKSYCTPESYKGTSSKLYRNLGDGRFEDVTAKAGLGDPNSKSLGVAVTDVNNDGWPDLFVANDTQPNKLYRNRGNGTFVEEAVSAGVAFGEDGVARGAMGVDAADYDRSGRQHLLVGNFSNQMLGLYHNEGKGLFVDEAPRSPVGRASLLSLAFGVFFLDYDLDGFLDIFAANGHIDEEIGRVQPKIAFKQPALLFRNDGKGRFVNASQSVGADLFRPVVARGAAYADFDHDGDLDILVSTNHGPAFLFRNDGGSANNWISVKLEGAKSNRSGLGAVVRVQSVGAGKQWQMVRSGSSYCSQSDLALTFGVAKDATVNVEIEWPSGARQQFPNVKANQRLKIHETTGIAR